MKDEYETPTLTRYGSVVSLTMGKLGSDVDGASTMIGNNSNSDIIGGGRNDGE